MSALPVIAIHGGAWAIPDHLANASVEGVKTAARVGHEVLSKGGSAVDAVEVAVRSMENDPVFDAGLYFCDRIMQLQNLLNKHCSKSFI